MNKDLFIHHLENQAPNLYKKIEEGLYADALQLLEMQSPQEKTKYHHWIRSLICLEFEYSYKIQTLKRVYRQKHVQKQ